MGIYFVAEWSVPEPDVTACEAALGLLADHVMEGHATIRSVRAYRQAWGPAPRRKYTWLEEFDSLAALEAEVETPACADAWRPIHSLAMPATFTGAIWTDLEPALGFQR